MKSKFSLLGLMTLMTVLSITVAKFKWDYDYEVNEMHGYCNIEFSSVDLADIASKWRMDVPLANRARVEVIGRFRGEGGLGENQVRFSIVCTYLLRKEKEALNHQRITKYLEDFIRERYGCDSCKVSELRI